MFICYEDGYGIFASLAGWSCVARMSIAEVCVVDVFCFAIVMSFCLCIGGGDEFQVSTMERI